MKLWLFISRRFCRGLFPLFVAWLSTAAPGLASSFAAASAPQTSIAVEALSRLEGMDLEANPAVKAAVLKVLDQVQGTPQFVQIIRQFKIKGKGEQLMEVAENNATNSTGAEAIRLVLAEGNEKIIQGGLAGTNALKVAQALGNTSQKEAAKILLSLVSDRARDVALRRESIRALAKSREGASDLLGLARANKLSADVELLAAQELNQSAWPEVKAEAARVLPLPQLAGAEVLPPISELVKRSGDPARGSQVFKRETVGCNKCHVVKGEGVDFGPSLSEIGTKLGKEAIYESILDPSAGIAFGFEGWQLELTNGEEASGLIVGETATEVSVKAVGGIVSHYKKNEIATRTKQTLSMMPAGLQQSMSTQDLIDLVEYLASLKR